MKFVKKNLVILSNALNAILDSVVIIENITVASLEYNAVIDMMNT